MKIKFPFLILLLALAVAACDSPKTNVNNPMSSPQVNVSAAATPSAAPANPQNKNYAGKGVVTKINLELVSVEVNHEKIEGLMEAMTMEFFVAKKAELEKLKVGDKVDFVIEYKDAQEKIISIKKAE